MKRYITIFLLLVIQSSQVLAENRLYSGDIAGAYKGKMQVKGGVSSVTTGFYLDAGEVKGKYLLEYKGERIVGELYNFIVTSKYSAKMHWQDKYEDGVLEVYFTSDYSSFSGNWGLVHTPNDHYWSGKKVAPGISVFIGTTSDPRALNDINSRYYNVVPPSKMTASELKLLLKEPSLTPKGRENAQMLLEEKDKTKAVRSSTSKHSNCGRLSSSDKWICYE
jgi:hypothetical protein